MKKKIVYSAVIFVICAALFAVCMLKKPSLEEEQVILENQYSREAFLNIKGWNIDGVSCETIKIPEDFSGIYKEYAAAQRSQDLPLEKYKGKEAERYLYNVNKNGNKAFAELLICENRLIAAAVIENNGDDIIIKPLENKRSN